MNRLALGAFSAMASILSVVLILELDSSDPASDAPLPPASGPPPGGTVSTTPQFPPHARWVEVILERPLFNKDRRPVSPTATPSSADTSRAPLPRLSGVIVSGTDRSAIFSPAGPGKPVVAREGGEVFGFIVQTIGAGQVTLMGNDGPRLLKPSPDPQAVRVAVPVVEPQAAFTPPAAPTGMPDLSAPGLASRPSGISQ